MGKLRAMVNVANAAALALSCIWCGARSELGVDVAVDAGPRDASVLDAGVLDGSTDAASAVDAAPDAGAPDARPFDAGRIDAGIIDASPIDASIVDADVPDSAVLDAPRLLAPLSTATVTSQRPTFHWELGAGDDGEDGAQIDVCRDRACSSVVLSFAATGTSGAPPTALAAGVYFWRAHGRANGAVGIATSAVWEVFVGARSAAVDTSWGSVLDVNGDGFADIATSTALNGRPTPLAGVKVYLGSASGPSATPVVLNGPTGNVASAGDVNGDGFADLIVGVAGADAQLYYGGPAGIATTPIAIAHPVGEAAFGDAVATAGDVNGDGYADVAITSPVPGLFPRQPSTLRVYLGGAGGIATTPIERTTGGYAFEVASGDVNGDGFSDVFVRADPDIDVFVGGAGGIAQMPIVIISGGGGVACAGDLDADGYADIVARPISASAWIYRGGPSGPSASTAITLFVSEGIQDSTVAGLGDLNGDGYSDFAAIGENGDLFVYFGQTGGVVSGVANWRRTLLRGPGNAALGWPLVGGGDVNGDELDDLIAGANNVVYVYLGTPSGISATPLP